MERRQGQARGRPSDRLSGPCCSLAFLLLVFLTLCRRGQSNEVAIEAGGASTDMDRDEVPAFSEPSRIILDTGALPRGPSPAARPDDMPDNVFVHQLLSGRDHARPGDARTRRETDLFRTAQSMQNYQYLVGGETSQEAAIVDGNYDPPGIMRRAGELGVRIVAYVATHFHWDHVGDASQGVDGLRWFVDTLGVPAYVAEVERDELLMRCNVTHQERVIGVAGGAVVKVGGVTLRFLSTPGHSPGGLTVRDVEPVLPNHRGLTVNGMRMVALCCSVLLASARPSCPPLKTPWRPLLLTSPWHPPVVPLPHPWCPPGVPAPCFPRGSGWGACADGRHTFSRIVRTNGSSGE